MELNFNKQPTDLDGKPIEGQTLGKILAQELAHSTQGDALKLFELALKLHKGEIVDIDTSDRKMLTEHVRSSQNLVNLAKGQLLQILESK